MAVGCPCKIYIFTCLFGRKVFDNGQTVNLALYSNLIRDIVGSILVTGEGYFDSICYNIYADGVKVNNSPVIETSYTHNSSLASEYRVSALYQEGESELSAPVMLSSSGINAVLDGGVRISVYGLRIKVTGAEQHYITIVSADGSLIYSNRGDADVEVIPGIYMIDISGQTIKAMVR